MAGEFQKGMLTMVFAQAVAAAAVIALSPKARETARPYLVQGIRRALALGEEFKGMIDEAKLEAGNLVREIEAERAAAPH
jgi:hypothetical protein